MKWRRRPVRAVPKGRRSFTRILWENGTQEKIPNPRSSRAPLNDFRGVKFCTEVWSLLQKNSIYMLSWICQQKWTEKYLFYMLDLGTQLIELDHILLNFPFGGFLRLSVNTAITKKKEVPNLYHKFGNMVIFPSGQLYIYFLTQETQHYQKIIYFFLIFFSSKMVEIGDQSLLSKNKGSIISRFIVIITTNSNKNITFTLSI